VLYKIKTQPTLEEGDIFTNNAEIYFDFNFPIITNTYSTTVGNQLSTPDNEVLDRIVIFPNPTDSFLYLQSTLTIKSYEIYDILGQKILSNVVISDRSAIDISSLQVGNYFIKILTNQGTSFERFIKQ
jgi:hypothetical protein